MKKGQKQEQTTEIEEKEEIIDNAVEEEDDDWFKVKEKFDAVEEATMDLPKPLDKAKRLTKTQLAKKLRKKNVLINKRIEYDEDGNVSDRILIIRINPIVFFLIR